jgi:hypothetical protein
MGAGAVGWYDQEEHLAPQVDIGGLEWTDDDDPWSPNTGPTQAVPIASERPAPAETTGWGLEDMAVDAGAPGGFPAAAVRLARERPHTAEASDASRDAAKVLLGLAASNDEASLREYLRPDPQQSDVTWTVACYQIGDLTPCALMDFASPVAAVNTLADCGQASHVAAEFVASTPAGSRWTALTRTGQTIGFQLPDGRTASDARRDGADSSPLATEHWRQQLHRWATTAPLDRRPTTSAASNEAIPSPQPAIQERPAPVAPTAAAGGDELERALALVVATLRKVESDLHGGGRTDVAVLSRLEALERRVSDFEAAFEVALDQRVHALARYCAELTRAFSAEQQAATARIESRLDDLIARLPKPLGTGGDDVNAEQRGGDVIAEA